MMLISLIFLNDNFKLLFVLSWDLIRTILLTIFFWLNRRIGFLAGGIAWWILTVMIWFCIYFFILHFWLVFHFNANIINWNWFINRLQLLIIVAILNLSFRWFNCLLFYAYFILFFVFWLQILHLILAFVLILVICWIVFMRLWLKFIYII